jgi:hypothetical protein
VKLRIESLAMREIRTQHGLAQVYDLTLSNGQSYDAFVGSWNCAWQKGQEIDIDSEQIGRREKGGRIYQTIRAPAAERNGAKPQAPGPVPEEGERGQAARLDAGGLLSAILDDEHEIEILIRLRRVRRNSSNHADSKSE